MGSAVSSSEDSAVTVSTGDDVSWIWAWRDDSESQSFPRCTLKYFDDSALSQSYTISFVCDLCSDWGWQLFDEQSSAQLEAARLGGGEAKGKQLVLLTGYHLHT